MAIGNGWDFPIVDSQSGYMSSENSENNISNKNYFGKNGDHYTETNMQQSSRTGVGAYTPKKSYQVAPLQPWVWCSSGAIQSKPYRGQTACHLSLANH